MKQTLWNKGWTWFSDIDATPKAVDLPHDAMREEKRLAALKDGTQTAFYPGGLYTYEKEFNVVAEDVSKPTVLEFEGVYMKSTVSLNGQKVGGRIYGYSDFFVDLTGKLKEGANKITVVADNTQFSNSRWYSGSGIYRDVWLHTGDTSYVKPDGVKVKTLSIAPASVEVMVDAVLEDGAAVSVEVCKDGVVVASGEGTTTVLEISDAKLWSAETPELYDVVVTLKKGGETLDTVSESFGIRSIAWDAKNGFQVNGETTLLRGGCVHHDHGVIGAAEYDAACERRVRIMKESGYNAVRISHHPASKAMLRACDKLGMYVMNETFDTWIGLKSPYDYAMYFREEHERDLTDMVRVSYNHPSVIMYSIGNEVHLKDVKKVTELTREMTDLCHRFDDSRPVLNAINPMTVMQGGDKDPEALRNDKVDPRATGKGSGLTGSLLVNVLITHMGKIIKLVGNPKKMKKIDAVFAPLDIVGYNYATYLYEPQHEDFPERVLVGSETFPQRIYDNWQAVKSMPWVVGDFMWTAWDYLGECGVGAVNYGKQGAFTQPFPTISAGCGSIDLNGEILPQGYYSGVVFGAYEKPYIAVHPVNHSGEEAFCGKWRLTDAVRSWTWPGHENKEATIDVYSGAATVELFQDGKSLGKQPVERCTATFTTPYVPGKLEAVQYDASGRETGRDFLETAGEKVLLNVSPEKETLQANGVDLCFLPMEFIDEKGTRQTTMSETVEVTVEGPATLLGFGNADLKQDSVNPYLGTTSKTYMGSALAVLRSTCETGDVTVTVSAPGAEAVTITLKAE